MKLLRLRIFLQDGLQWALEIDLQTIPNLLIRQLVTLLLHLMSNALSDQIKSHLVRHFVEIDQRFEDLDAEISLTDLCRHLQVDCVDEAQH